jgi:NADH-quinone oxidoreductase subunit D
MILSLRSFSTIQDNKAFRKNLNANIKNSYLLNFGPQHPAAHGVLRLLLELHGEQVIRLDPHIGLLHRGTEKLIENKKYLQSIPYFDRLDYVSMLAQEHAYVLAIEHLLNIKVNKRFQYIRVLFDEITRLLNHIMSLTTHALDVGAITPFLWGFEEREKLMFLYEKVSGARMHASYYRPGGVTFDLPDFLLKDVLEIVVKFPQFIDNLEELLTENPIWKSRLQGIGLLSKKDCLAYGFSGPMIRASGIPWDIRVTEPYETYKDLNVGISVAFGNDCYSRYLVRIYEMRQSLLLIIKCIAFLQNNLKVQEDNNINNLYFESPFLCQKTNLSYSMEALIKHFRIFGSGVHVPKGSIYCAVEAPKGETGVLLISNGSIYPSRCKIKAPGFLHLQGLSLISENHFLADVVTNIGTLDIVFGEVDR